MVETLQESAKSERGNCFKKFNFKRFIVLAIVYLLVNGGFVATIYYTKPWDWGVWQMLGMK